MPLSPAQQYLVDFIDLANRKTWTSRDIHLDTIEGLHRRMDHASREGILLSFTLAKIYDDLGDPDRSFALLLEGNRHHKRGKTDTIEDARAATARVKAIFRQPLPAPLPEPTGQKPLFIVGMPRSGTTLVEQILATHSRVHGAGELKLMGQWCYGYLKLYGTHGQNANLSKYLPQLQRHYIDGLQSLTPQPVITDKMPVNFLWLGFIRSAFPTAPIIHTVRHPMAVCWSIFKTPFAGTSNGYACDLADIGEFYRLYLSLMDFWNERFPDAVYQLNYETLTKNQEGESRKLLERCGLSWEESCLEFYNNPREVRTVSKEQVRRPMYQGSSDAWRRYEHRLGPLKKALEDVL